MNVVEREERANDDAERLTSTYWERAKKLARPAATLDIQEAVTPVLVFRLNEDRYAIELADIATVFGALRCTTVPESDAHLEGLINVNGAVRPVLNLRFLLGLAPESDNANAYFLLLRRKQHELGVKVGQLDHVERISMHELQCPGGGSGIRCIRGVTPDTLTVLSTGELFGAFWNEGRDS